MNGARGWHKVSCGFFSAQAHFYGMSVDADILLIDWERLPVGNLQLHGNKVVSRDHLSHRVFYLQPGIHLQKIERVVAVEQKLNGAGAAVVYCLCGFDCGRSHLFSEFTAH